MLKQDLTAVCGLIKVCTSAMCPKGSYSIGFRLSAIEKKQHLKRANFLAGAFNKEPIISIGSFGNQLTDYQGTCTLFFQSAKNLFRNFYR